MLTLLLLIALFAGDLPSVAVADSDVFEKTRAQAEQGDAQAQTALGAIYLAGREIPQDYAEALLWYRKAANQGYAEAQFYLGVMYERGQGVPLNFAEAVKWYRKAADQGYAEAQYNLEILYAMGGGVAQDFVQAHTWLNLAASHFPAGHYRDDAVTVRDLVVAPNMTTAQITQAQKLAREWKPTAPKP